MNKREAVLSLLDPDQTPPYTPAAFFLHFGQDYQTAPAAVDKHLEYFHATGMDFVKIQYEHHFPHMPEIQEPADWAKVPVYSEDFFEPPLRVLEGLVKAAKDEALIVQTLYSPFMIAGQVASGELVEQHIRQDPQAFQQGIAAITASLVNFVRAAIRTGADGFYASTQGGEAHRFNTSDSGLSDSEGLRLFEQCIKPYDLELMTEANRGTLFNILHICDYHLMYDDLTRFLDYPGQVVNCNLELVNGALSAQEAGHLFRRPFMGGMNRLGVITRGTQAEVRAASERALMAAPDRFILAADCTVPATTPWENLKAAIEVAHAHHP